MGLTLIQQISFKIFTLIVTIMYSINGGIVAPSTADPIKAKDPDSVKMVFATIADPQVSNYMFSRYQSFQEACMDLKNAETEFDAIVGVGDIAENGLLEEYQLVYDEINGLSDRFIMATGNHDIRLRAYSQSYMRFSDFTNALNRNDNMTKNAYAEGKFAYSEVVNGYKFIVMGSDKTEFEEAYISPEQLVWLDNELATEKGKPVIDVLHQPLKLTHNLGQRHQQGGRFRRRPERRNQGCSCKARRRQHRNPYHRSPSRRLQPVQLRADRRLPFIQRSRAFN